MPVSGPGLIQISRQAMNEANVHRGVGAVVWNCHSVRTTLWVVRETRPGPVSWGVGGVSRTRATIRVRRLRGFSRVAVGPRPLHGCGISLSANLFIGQDFNEVRSKGKFVQVHHWLVYLSLDL